MCARALSFLIPSLVLYYAWPTYGFGLGSPPRFCVCSGLETVEFRRKGEGQKEEREGDGLSYEWRATLCLPELWLVRRVSNFHCHALAITRRAGGRQMVASSFVLLASMTVVPSGSLCKLSLTGTQIRQMGDFFCQPTCTFLIWVIWSVSVSRQFYPMDSDSLFIMICPFQNLSSAVYAAVYIL
ncbi:uncharacterized protein BO87DRAFT_393117 [Aspergillus neoniger CBS 115656]|uniref:Ig-like domain-containing protein n=1 Tax=Aspergillus neoniger (strain CBS 115656) TaxID=1448310 RepID=A0A318YWB2_ASPNB|nr:hypothetical protein BO87DRAFT_393117 [Aspergillus neoniger CBS 115656]PYH38514.1 hypothetical protein BO87DRAFT_393117 [Aspergillus neoniger CBS 115656]